MKFTIHNFKTLKGLTIEVPATLQGGNGVGKTTVLEAISFCLTGRNFDGKEFDQVYHRDVELEQAIADVSYYDDYGNEWRRTVKPTFQIDKKGESKLKILRSTTCRKNDIVVNDYASDFSAFYKLGTDYFFNLKEAEQRSIFIDLLKSKMPDFDVKNAQDRLKELERTNRDNVERIKELRKAINSREPASVPTMPAELETAENEYQKAITAGQGNEEQIKAINSRNNAKMTAYNTEKSNLENHKAGIERDIAKYTADIEAVKEEIEARKRAKFKPNQLAPTNDIDSRIEGVKSRLTSLQHYKTLEDYLWGVGVNNETVKENIETIKELATAPLNFSEACPCCGVVSEKSKAEAQRLAKEQRESTILRLKADNRNILERELATNNLIYQVAKDRLSLLIDERNQIVTNNTAIEQDNEERARNFENQKNDVLSGLQTKIDLYTQKVKDLKLELEKYEVAISAMQKPVFEILPETSLISDELKQKHDEYIEVRDNIVGSKAINSNNERLTTQDKQSISDLQHQIAELDVDIVKLKGQITDYFASLAGVVKQEFAGILSIDVQLLEYVITKDEYKDCFKITANGKVYPSECNGALQNNVRTQILAGLQRLSGYEGITILDNSEANTTQPIDSNGLSLVMAQATFDNQLIINQSK